MTTTTQTAPGERPPLSYTARPPRNGRRQFNWRLLVFIAAVALPFIYILYVFLDQQISGGVHDRGDYVEVNLKALGNFPFNADIGDINDVPQRYRGLDGKRVKVKGFMVPGRSAGRSGAGEEVQFVWNVQQCCFSGPPQVQERIFAVIPPDRKDVEIYDQQTFVELTGILHVRVRRNEVGGVYSVYDMDVEQTRPIRDG